jgi:two-component system NtrC family sensor kinase
MTTVRLRLLILALAPLVLLMPLLLLLGMTRWTGDYDKVLAANVQSDLRIAEQYLSQLMARTGEELTGVAQSLAFDAALEGDGPEPRFLDAKRRELGLDFLYYLPSGSEDVGAAWPVIEAARQGRARTAIDIFPPEVLAALPGELETRARIDLIETTAAVPTDRQVEDRGMVVHAASPVRLPGHEGVLVGGVLLNGNLGFIDAINALVYLNPVTGGTRQGTATLFLEDVRISTNVRLFEDVRALGTRVSASVREAVLDEGQTWLDRAFVVNDWYISGYLPLTDSFGERVGMLYVGMLEAPFAQAKRDAYLWMMAAFAAVMLLSAPVFLWMAKGIFAPLERMTLIMRRVGRGNLAARIGPVGARDEIGQVAGHLDDLLDQVQDRDLKLRAWAEELEDRVDTRTAELREANAKLEQTFRQLVMSEKLAAIGEITAGVAHEINNPMAVIQGNVDVIRMELGEEAGRVETELTLIDRQVMRMEAIVGKLLKFAQPSEYSDCAETVALAPVVEDSLMLVDHALSKGAIEVQTDLPDLPPVAIDAGEMQQVAINLILNAAQAMGGRGHLWLRLDEETRDGVAGVVLTVRDSGPGIAEDALGSLFDPFFTTRRGEGTGLGLSISQSIVQGAGGIIMAGNAPEGGAVFTVWLPVA